MLLELQTALMARYNSAAGATLRGLVQGMWEDEAPADVVLGTQAGTELENSVKPFVTFSIIFTFLDQNFCANLYEPLVQFTVFSDADNNSSSAALQAQNALLDLYNAQLMTMSNGHTMVSSKVVGQRKFKDQNKMWNVITEIQYIVEKDR